MKPAFNIPGVFKVSKNNNLADASHLAGEKCCNNRQHENEAVVPPGANPDQATQRV